MLFILKKIKDQVSPETYKKLEDFGRRFDFNKHAEFVRAYKHKKDALFTEALENTKNWMFGENPEFVEIKEELEKKRDIFNKSSILDLILGYPAFAEIDTSEMYEKMGYLVYTTAMIDKVDKYDFLAVSYKNKTIEAVQVKTTISEIRALEIILDYKKILVPFDFDFHFPTIKDFTRNRRLIVMAMDTFRSFNKKIEQKSDANLSPEEQAAGSGHPQTKH